MPATAKTGTQREILSATSVFHKSELTSTYYAFRPLQTQQIDKVMSMRIWKAEQRFCCSRPTSILYHRIPGQHLTCPLE